MKIKKTIAVLIGAATISLSGVTAFAAPTAMPDGEIFDAEFYAKTYPDVVAVLGNSTDALYSHYKTYGKKEGRMPYAPGTATTATVNAPSSAIKMPDGTLFDPVFYAKTYPDVIAVLGTDANALYNHYKTYGKKEGRLPYAQAQATTAAAAEDTTATTPTAPAAKQFAGSYLYKLYGQQSVVKLSAGSNNTLKLKTGKGGTFTYTGATGVNNDVYHYLNEDGSLELTFYGNTLTVKDTTGLAIPMICTKM